MLFEHESQTQNLQSILASLHVEHRVLCNALDIPTQKWRFPDFYGFSILNHPGIGVPQNGETMCHKTYLTRLYRLPVDRAW